MNATTIIVEVQFMHEGKVCTDFVQVSGDLSSAEQALYRRCFFDHYSDGSKVPEEHMALFKIPDATLICDDKKKVELQNDGPLIVYDDAGAEYFRVEFAPSVPRAIRIALFNLFIFRGV